MNAKLRLKSPCTQVCMTDWHQVRKRVPGVAHCPGPWQKLKILLPPYLLSGDQLSLFSNLSHHIFHQIVHHIWVKDSTLPPPVTLIFFCCLHCPHVSAMGFPQLGNITISEDGSTTVFHGCISAFVLWPFGEPRSILQCWEFRITKNAGWSAQLEQTEINYTWFSELLH